MNLLPYVIALHLLSAVIWVGGMFFAYVVLRPVAASTLEPPERQTVWVGVFRTFFPWVWTAVIILLVTGYWMLFSLFGGFGNAPLYIHIMNGLGLLMVAIYFYVFFVLYQGLKRSVATQQWPEGAKYLARFRIAVAINMKLGLIVVAVAAAGRYF